MVFGGIVVGLILMGVMIYLALNKKSNTSMRYAALIALGVMILTIIICLFIIFSSRTIPVDWSVYEVGETPAEPVKTSSNLWVVFFLMVILLGVFTTIFILAMKEKKKHAGEKDSNKSISNW